MSLPDPSFDVPRDDRLDRLKAARARAKYAAERLESEGANFGAVFSVLKELGVVVLGMSVRLAVSNADDIYAHADRALKDYLQR